MEDPSTTSHDSDLLFGERLILVSCTHYKISEGRTVSYLFYRKAGGPDEVPVRTQNFEFLCLPDTVDPRGPTFAGCQPDWEGF